MKGIHGAAQREGSEKLAIRIGGGDPRPTGQTLARLLRVSGRLVVQGRVEDWRIEASAETEEGLLFYGPAFEGASLDELCCSDREAIPAAATVPAAEAGLSAVAAAARALALAAEANALPRGILSSGLLVGPSGDVLILPPDLSLRAFRALGEEGRKNAAAYLRSPKAEGAEAEAAFLVAQAAYRAASGRSAYPVGTADQELASGGFVPLAELRPRLDPALAAAIDAALSTPEAASLVGLRDALAAASARGWWRNLSVDETRAYERRLAAAEAKLESSRRRSAFLRKRGGLLVAAGAVLVLALVVTLSVVDARRGRPNYSTLEPRALVEAYYRAIDGLDLDSLEACAEKGAAKQDVNYVSTLTVITKMRTAYEGLSPIVKASDWIKEGKPSLDPNRTLFGLSGLTLDELSAGPAEAVYRAEYSSWALGHEESADASAEAGKTLVLERRLSDLLRLEKDAKKGWRIVRIDRVER